MIERLSLLPGGAGFKDIRFFGGYGKAEFTMSRGSFKVKDRVNEKIPLNLTNDGERLVLADSKGAFLDRFAGGIRRARIWLR